MIILLKIIQSITAIFTIILVLIQVRGTGFGRSASSSSFTRRGVERIVFRLTFIVVALFLLSSIGLLLV